MASPAEANTFVMIRLRIMTLFSLSTRRPTPFKAEGKYGHQLTKKGTINNKLTSALGTEEGLVRPDLDDNVTSNSALNDDNGSS